MKASYISLGALIGFAFLVAGCSTEPRTQSGRERLTDDSRSAIAAFEDKDPGMRDFLDRSAGYAIFPSVGKGGFIVGAAYGHGEVYSHGNMIGYANMTQGSVGAQAGGEDFSELIVFENRDALDHFTAGNFTFAADISAVAIKSGVAKDAKFQNGTAVFVNPKGGLMASAVVGGQKFNYEPR